MLHIYYKEWLKTRWFAVFTIILGVGICLYIYLDITSSFKIHGAFDYIIRVMYSNPQANFYRALLMYYPLVTSFCIGLSQYLPEVIDRKIKLTLHLPLKHNSVLTMMQSFGVLLLTIIYSIVILLFFLIGFKFFPVEVNRAFAISLAPWLLGGYASYFMISMISLEPVFFKQIIFAVVAYFFVKLYYVGYEHGDTVSLILPLLLLMLIAGLTQFYTINRFIKGNS